MSYEYAVVEIPNKVPVSMRLPLPVVEAVADYAEKQAIRKTDAYIYFLERGINAQKQEDEFNGRLSALEEKLDRVLSLLEKPAP